MHTNNMADLAKIKGLSNHLGSFRQTGEYECLDYEAYLLIKDIPRRYELTMRAYENQIKALFMGVYGRHIPFCRADVSDINFKLKRIQQNTGKNLTLIAIQVKTYAQMTSLFKRLGDRYVPISLDRIEKAWLKMNEGGSRQEVKNILYK